MKSYLEYTVYVQGDEQDSIAQLFQLGAESFIQEKECILFYLHPLLPEKMSIENFLQENKLHFICTVCKNEDWNSIWESSFQPIQIENELYVRAAFHPQKTDCKNDLIIAPKMAFGTGHHATTYMILDWMAKYDLTGKQVLDFGCGTGILGLYALQKKAALVDVVDNDPNCIENVQENADLNQLNIHNIILGSSDSIPIEKYDLILANITRNVILENLAVLLKHAKLNGVFAFSGFLKEDENTMTHTFDLHGLIILERIYKEEWCCLIVQSEGPPQTVLNPHRPDQQAIQ